MLYNKIFLKILTIIAICITINSTLIYAAEETNIYDSSISKASDEQYVSKITDAEYSSIETILEYISKEIKSISNKISLSRNLNEYDTYPAVRLNLDTPYFGISSIIDSRLKIVNNVSTVDIASGYSIKNIVNKKVIKLESFEVSNIVVITRDVKIDKDMTSADAKVCISKLLEYLQQTKSANKFLDKQLMLIMQGYHTIEKTTNINNINAQISEIEKNLNDSLSELSYINAITENDITEDINAWYKYDYRVSVIESKVKDILTTDEKLSQIYQDTIKLNTEVKEFNSNVNKKYTDVYNNIDLQKSVYLINLKMNNEMKYLQDYITNSKTLVTSESQGTTDVNSNNNVNTTNTSSEVNIYDTVYQTASEAILTNMKKDLAGANEILDKVVKNNLVSADITNKEVLDAKSTVDELLKIYISFLNKENVFLTENAKANITEIKKSDNLYIGSFSDFEYIYINISDVLTTISDNFVSNSIISNIKTSDSLKQVITKVIACSKSLKEQNKANLQ